MYPPFTKLGQGLPHSFLPLWNSSDESPFPDLNSTSMSDLAFARIAGAMYFYLFGESTLYIWIHTFSCTHLGLCINSLTRPELGNWTATCRITRAQVGLSINCSRHSYFKLIKIKEPCLSHSIQFLRPRIKHLYAHPTCDVYSLRIVRPWPPWVLTDIGYSSIPSLH